MPELIEGRLWETNHPQTLVTYMVDEVRAHVKDYQTDVAYDAAVIVSTSNHSWESDSFLWFLRPMGTHLYLVGDDYAYDSVDNLLQNQEIVAMYTIFKSDDQYVMRKITSDEVRRIMERQHG